MSEPDTEHAAGTRPNGSGISIAFPISNNNVLDRSSIFFRWASDAALCNRRSNFAVVGRLDRHQVR